MRKERMTIPKGGFTSLDLPRENLINKLCALARDIDGTKAKLINYDRHWKLADGINIETAQKALMIIDADKSIPARKMSDYLCGYMYGLEEKTKIDCRCLGGVRAGINNAPQIHLIFAGRSQLNKNAGRRKN